MHSYYPRKNIILFDLSLSLPFKARSRSKYPMPAPPTAKNSACPIFVFPVRSLSFQVLPILFQHKVPCYVKVHCHWIFTLTCELMTGASPWYSRSLYHLIGEIKTWLNINHIPVHNNTYCIF